MSISTLWTDFADYDRGYAPSVALTDQAVIEVHQALGGAGPLWTRVGTLVEATGIDWADSAQFDSGFRPSVAARDNTIVEVHEDSDGGGQLWARIGFLERDGIRWGDSAPVGPGRSPSVTLNATHVYLAYQSADEIGPLFLAVGRHVSTAITWDTTFWYDTGTRPCVAATDRTLVEVHQAQAGVGALWSRAGALGADGSVTFADSLAYDNGRRPALAACPAGPAGTAVTELHQANAVDGTLHLAVGSAGERAVQWGTGVFPADDHDRAGIAAVALEPGREMVRNTVVVQESQARPGVLTARLGADRVFSATRT